MLERSLLTTEATGLTSLTSLPARSTVKERRYDPRKLLFIYFTFLGNDLGVQTCRALSRQTLLFFISSTSIVLLKVSRGSLLLSIRSTRPTLLRSPRMLPTPLLPTRPLVSFTCRRLRSMTLIRSATPFVPFWWDQFLRDSSLLTHVIFRKPAKRVTRSSPGLVLPRRTSRLRTW